jgi:hypothetical protein
MAAWGDGMVIPPVAYPAKVTVPDQRAFICWSNGTERLAIETEFTGVGTNFAWVVPLPSKPIIEEATSGLFTTLEYLFRPTIIHNVTPWYLVFLICTGIVYLLLTVRRNTPPRVSDTAISLLIALAAIPLSGCAAFLLVVLLPYGVWRLRTGKETVGSILAVLFIVLLMSCLFLPALGTLSLSASATDISVVGRETIGEYDTTTIMAKTPRALADWLRDNGYLVPPAANRVVSNYVSRGWVFVATKLRRDIATQSTDSPHPLCFTFRADKAVYPMQLTGIGNTNLAVDLFVFGPARAEATFFHTDRCARPSFPDPESYPRGSTSELPVVHPLLRKWVAGAAVATKLSANLTPEMMTQDIELQWGPFSEFHRKVYSYHGAGIFSLNRGVSVFVAVLFLASVVTAFKREWRPQLKFIAGWAAIAGLVVTAGFFSAVPKMAVRLIRAPWSYSQMNLMDLALGFEKETPTNGVSSLAEARAVLKKIEGQQPKLTGQNFLLGGPVREEDSPGNYILRQGTNGVDFVWFDADGGEKMTILER